MCLQHAVSSKRQLEDPSPRHKQVLRPVVAYYGAFLEFAVSPSIFPIASTQPHLSIEAADRGLLGGGLLLPLVLGCLKGRRAGMPGSRQLCLDRGAHHALLVLQASNLGGHLSSSSTSLSASQMARGLYACVALF